MPVHLFYVRSSHFAHKLPARIKQLAKLDCLVLAYALALGAVASLGGMSGRMLYINASLPATLRFRESLDRVGLLPGSIPLNPAFSIWKNMEKPPGCLGKPRPTRRLTCVRIAQHHLEGRCARPVLRPGPSWPCGDRRRRAWIMETSCGDHQVFECVFEEVDGGVYLYFPSLRSNFEQTKNEHTRTSPKKVGWRA